VHEVKRNAPLSLRWSVIIECTVVGEAVRFRCAVTHPTSLIFASLINKKGELVGRLVSYFYDIKFSKLVLWCYLIWYLVIVYFYFDPSPKIWINSIGISVVIGTALMLSVSGNDADRWQTFRLYLMPFCVSSFSALIKDQGFMVILSPKINETGVAILGCTLFLFFVFAIKQIKTNHETP
jgi:hypothetical protein